MADLSEGGQSGARERNAGAGDEIFLLLRTISYFTYEMVKNQGKIAMEGDLNPSSCHNHTPFH